MNLHRWYPQLASLLDAGIALPSALREAAGPPGEDREIMAARLEAGESVDNVLREAPPWLPDADRLLLSAAAESGRLPQAAIMLGERHTLQHEARQQIVGASIYPLVLLHFAGLLWAMQGILTPELTLDFAGFGLRAILVLGPLWAIILGLRYLLRRHPTPTRAVLGKLPLIRSYLRQQALADFAFALDALLEAQSPPDEAWYGAALVTGDKRLLRATEQMAPQMRQGANPADLLANSSPVLRDAFPSDFSAAVRTGQQTGSMHRALPRLAAHHRTEADRALRRISFWIPKLLFLLIAIVIAINIVVQFMAYLDGLDLDELLGEGL